MPALRHATPLLASLTWMMAVGCGHGPSGQETATTSAAPPVDSTPVVVAPPPLDDTLEGEGYKIAKPVSDPALSCKQSTFEMASYLLRGELSLAGRPTAHGGEIAGSWLVQLRGEAQIAFAGFDGQTRRIGRDRGIGNSREHAPTLFATGDTWTVLWFDDQGLAFAHPTWDTLPKPEIEHLSVVKDVDPANIALGVTPDGAFVVASPFGTQGDQLSLFVFGAPGTKPQALGITKFAKSPKSPAVAADADGFTVAWSEEGGIIRATRFDREGKELGNGAPVVGSAAARTSVQLVSIADATMLVWQEGEKILARKLDNKGNAASKILVVAAKGKFPTTMGAGSDAIVAFLGEADGVADQLIAARLSASGVAETAYRVSDGKLPVLDPPAVASLGDRVAFAWTETMGVALSSKRAWLRTIDAACAK